MHDYSTLPLFSLQPETKEIPLSKGKVAIVDAADYEWLNQWKWSASENRSGTWYARRSLGTRDEQHTLMMHRAILNVQSKLHVDHINGNGLDNRRFNLRLCTPAQNQYNRGICANNTSGFKGVYWVKGHEKWQAQIHVNGKHYHLGFFDTAEAAAYAYDTAALELHGEFAKLNCRRTQEPTP